LGTRRGAHLLRTLDKQMGRALEMERLNLRELCEGNLKGGSFTVDPEGYARESSGNGQLSP